MSKSDQIISEHYAEDILNAYESNRKPSKLSIELLLNSTAHLIKDGDPYGPNLCCLQDYLNTQHIYADKVLNYLKEKQKTIEESKWNFPIPGPSFITTEDFIMKLYWMQLVQDFGYYIASPRYGWVYRDKLDDCINHLTEIINKRYG